MLWSLVWFRAQEETINCKGFDRIALQLVYKQMYYSLVLSIHFAFQKTKQGTKLWFRFMAAIKLNCELIQRFFFRDVHLEL